MTLGVRCSHDSQCVRLFEIDDGVRGNCTARQLTGCGHVCRGAPNTSECTHVVAHTNICRDSQEIPVEELEARDTDKIVDVFHFMKEP